LLNFRAYDTWLELGVLLLALIGVLCARGETTLASGHPLSSKGQVLDWLVRWLTPVLVIVAGYLLWLGKTTSGGAFQAGVVLGAAGVLLWLSGEPVLERLPGILWRGLAALGFAAFLAAGLASVFTGRYFLEYPEGWAGALILWIECAAAVSIGCTLAALFSAMHPPRQSQLSLEKQPKEGTE
jgi:multisubunit Na+/H+ antiporter MnhB subunit